MSFDQGCDLTVLAAKQQISLPVARHRTILSLSGSLTDRDSIDNLTTIDYLLCVVS